jgi:cob(I)alamin adenosyltransferase
MKIYTKGGDKGNTSLVGGARVPKSHIRLESYGSVDELIAYIGLLRDLLEQDTIKGFLKGIQDRLMTCAAILASDCENCDVQIPEMEEADVTLLEEAIDEIENDLPPLSSFVLPGGNYHSSQCQIARTVCRRAERQIIKLSAEHFVPEIVIKYINRLSDYLFVLARRVLHDANGEELPWKPRL